MSNIPKQISAAIYLPGITDFVNGGIVKPVIGNWRGELAGARIRLFKLVPILKKTNEEKRLKMHVVITNKKSLLKT